MPSHHHRIIAVIGAGPSGLVAAKEVLQNGLKPLVFEKSSGIGGLWGLDPEVRGVWSSMHTNLSKYTCVFTGCPWPPHTPTFPSSTQVYEYLQSYMESFDLSSHIRFNTTVTRVSRSEDELDWDLEWIDDKGHVETQVFEGVMVCSGIFSVPFIPDLGQLEKFTGSKIHSKNFRDGALFRDQMVLVIGGGISGEQVSSELSGFAAKVYHNFRKRFWLLNPYLPVNPSDPESPKLPLDLVFYNRKFYNQPGITTTCSREEVIIGKNRRMASYCAEQQTIPELRIPDEDFASPIQVTISEYYLQATKAKVIIPIGGQEIRGFGSNWVSFEDGEEVQIHTVIFCTGYNLNLSFLSEPILRILNFDPMDQLQPFLAFKATLHPKLRGLFFVGCYKGPYFATMEVQAQLGARLLAGKVKYPPWEIMNNGIEEEKRIRDQVPRDQFPHSDYVKFTDEIGRWTGCLPDFSSLEAFEGSLAIGCLDSKKVGSKVIQQLYEKFMEGPVIPQHYNLFDGFEEAMGQIDKVNRLTCGILEEEGSF